MARDHFIVPQLPLDHVTTVRLGIDNTTANNFSDKENGKLVKLGGESRYVMAVAGDPIEGVIVSVEAATQDGYSIGGIKDTGKFFANADGLQATPGTGTIAIGDFVVVGTVVAKGTAQTGWPKVCKATAQPGATLADLAAATAAIKASLFTWRVVSLGPVGTGAVGTDIVVARV